jgi:hypothetical protein
MSPTSGRLAAGEAIVLPEMAAIDHSSDGFNYSPLILDATFWRWDNNDGFFSSAGVVWAMSGGIHRRHVVRA